MEAQHHLSLRDYGRLITKRWKIILLFVMAGLAVGAYKFTHTDYAFSASSQVFLSHQTGYVIASGPSRDLMGSAASTKQELQFIESPDFVDLSRSVAELAPEIHLDLKNTAALDDISTIITRDVLNSRPVTPVRLILYNQPSPNLLSSEQEATLVQAKPLQKGLETLAYLASRDSTGGRYDIYRGWQRGHPGTSDHAVWQNLQELAHSALVQDTMLQLGVSDQAARDEMNVGNDQNEEKMVTGTRLAMAARTLYTLTEITRLANYGKDKPEIAASIETAPDGTALLAEARKIMTSEYVVKMKNGPGPLSWPDDPAGRQTAIQTMYYLVRLQHRKGDPKHAVWDISGKEVTDGTDVIAVSQTAPSPGEARDAANAMAAVMVWKDRMSKVAEEERSVQFLKATLGDENGGATKFLQDADSRLTEYQKAHHLLDVSTELKTAAERAGSLDAQLGDAEAGIRETSATLDKSMSQLGDTQTWVKAPTITQNPLIAGIKTDIIKSETTLAGLRAQGYTEEWPAVMAETAQLNNLQQRLKQEVLTNISQQYTPDPVHIQLLQRVADLESKKVGLEARRQAIASLLGQENGRFDKLPDVQAGYLNLVRKQALAEQQYTNIYGRLLDAKNNRAMKQGNARVVAVAEEPGTKVAPRLSRTIIAATLLGLFLGCLCALALSTTDTQIRSAEDVRRELSLPVLAHLPAIPADGTLIVESKPASAITEGFRSLRTTIRFMGGDKPLHSIAATSTKAAEGKSSVVANLAASLAQAGLVVTAVDADLRRPRLAGFFGIPTTSGLSDALATPGSARQARQATRIPGLYVVPAGPAKTNPGELLDNGRIGKVLAELGDGSDMIVVDTPPIGVVTDAALVGSAADATIFVIESGTVEPEEARAALAKLTQNARANVIGVVLVGGDAPVSSDYVRYVSASNIDGHGLDAPGGSRRPRGRAKA